MKKITALVLALVLALALSAVVAEDIPEFVRFRIDNYTVNPETDGQSIWARCDFEWGNQSLSWYEDFPFASGPREVTIWLPGLECIDAEPVEGGVVE